MITYNYLLLNIKFILIMFIFKKIIIVKYKYIKNNNIKIKYFYNLYGIYQVFMQ